MRLLWKSFRRSYPLHVLFKDEIYIELNTILHRIELPPKKLINDYNIEAENTDEKINIIVSGNNKQANENLKQVALYRKLNKI